RRIRETRLQSDDKSDEKSDEESSGEKWSDGE
ncbi:hypothetical protein Tco_0546983, partial [Tanacetum coccineum]